MCVGADQQRDIGVAAAVQLPEVGDEPRLTSRIAPRGRGLFRVVPCDAGTDQGPGGKLVQVQLNLCPEGLHRAPHAVSKSQFCILPSSPIFTDVTSREPHASPGLRRMPPVILLCQSVQRATT